jgi:hypothetical protein
MIITDPSTNLTATIGGDQSILNAVYVKGGLNVLSGGAIIKGGITTSTTNGSSNTSMNTPFDTISGYLPSSQNVVLGYAAMGLSQNSNRNVIVGYNSNFGLQGTTGVQDNVVIGANSGASSNQNVIIGSYCSTGGGGGGNIIMGYNTNRSSALKTVGIMIGNNSYNISDPFGGLASSNTIGIGHNIFQQSADLYNTGIGHYTFQNLYGTNGSTGGVGYPAYTTQYNSSLGYYSGQSRQRYNKCLFLGALADASLDNLTQATAIGYNCKVDASNTIQLGSNAETVSISGSLRSGSNIISPARLGYLSTASGGLVDLNSTQTIGGAKTFNADLTLGANLISGANTITPTQLGYLTTVSGGIVDLNSTQTIGGAKTFNADLTLGANLVSGANNITPTQLGYLTTVSGGIVDFNSTQTITSAKTINADLTLGANLISGANTITPTQLGYLSTASGGLVDLNSTQTIVGAKTFNANLTLGANLVSGANTITSAQLGYLTTVSGGIVDLNSTQTVTGSKTYSGLFVPRFLVPIPTSSMNLASASVATTYGIGVGAMANFASNGITLDCIGIGNAVFGLGTNVSSCVAIGTSSQKAMTSGAVSNVSVGNRSLLLGTVNQQCSAFGEETLYNTTGNGNSAFGFRAGYSTTTTSNANCTFLGALTDACSNTINNSTVIGYNAKTTASNQVVLGTSAETVVIAGATSATGNVTVSTGNVTVSTGFIQSSRGMQVHSSYTSPLATNFTISVPIYGIYPVNPTANITVTLPAASAALAGVFIIIRRVGGTAATSVTSASANVYPLNSFTAGTTVLAASAYSVRLCCTYLTGSTYGWFIY